MRMTIEFDPEDGSNLYRVFNMIEKLIEELPGTSLAESIQGRDDEDH